MAAPNLTIPSTAASLISPPVTPYVAGFPNLDLDPLVALTIPESVWKTTERSDGLKAEIRTFLIRHARDSYCKHTLEGIAKPDEVKPEVCTAVVEQYSAYIIAEVNEMMENCTHEAGRDVYRFSAALSDSTLADFVSSGKLLKTNPTIGFMVDRALALLNKMLETNEGTLEALVKEAGDLAARFEIEFPATFDPSVGLTETAVLGHSRSFANELLRHDKVTGPDAAEDAEDVDIDALGTDEEWMDSAEMLDFSLDLVHGVYAVLRAAAGLTQGKQKMDD